MFFVFLCQGSFRGGGFSFLGQLNDTPVVPLHEVFSDQVIVKIGVET